MFDEKLINSVKEYFNKLENWEERLDESIKSLKECLEKTEADLKEIDIVLDSEFEESGKNALKVTKNKLESIYNNFPRVYVPRSNKRKRIFKTKSKS